MLNSHYYTIKNALTWKIYAGHCEESEVGNLGHRVIHAAIAGAQFFPILSQINSLFELAIVRLIELVNVLGRNLVGKIFTKKNEPALDISRRTFKNDVERANALLFDFYKGTGKDIEGRMLKDIWKYSDYSMESIHSYIQWLFPSMRGSAHNDKAPVLANEKALVEKMRNDPEVMKNLKTSFNMMMKFYELRYDEATKKVEKTSNFNSRAKYWITSNNHNFLRITRILGCLANFGLITEARAFLAQLKIIEAANPAIIGPAYKHWAKTLAGK